MRIISGKYKGRRISPPKKLPVRPTTDMCKEALFNILNNNFNFSELKILDIFAGTGSISYEFASRGAKPITCIDGDAGCVNFIKKTTEEFDFDITALKSDVFAFLEKCKSSYDIIFADPPYGLELASFEKIIQLVFEKELLEEDGIMVMEHSKHTKLDHMENFSFSKIYGGSVFSFFELDQDEEETSEENTESED